MKIEIDKPAVEKEPSTTNDVDSTIVITDEEADAESTAESEPNLMKTMIQRIKQEGINDPTEIIRFLQKKPT